MNTILATPASLTLPPFTMPSTIATRRLRLVPWRSDHFPRVAVFNRDPRATRFLGGASTDDGAAWRAFAAIAGHWTLRGYGLYAVEEESGLLVGGVGLYHPQDWPEPELGYLLLPDRQGRGYATEAARAVRDAAMARGLVRLASFIHPENRASIRLAERLGARAEGTRDLYGTTFVRYCHDMAGAAHASSSTLH
ncbi:GNAT family N-acetyltransferase [Acuticoccus mangrovi]|uniref:GNAT family N-acetyltransferase n=1 Tax=Acuticoccus mangrovi TaxID=2796142 RepID=A0A934IPT3_9HYPH|nr:GNAT family N-acetyltransferase [Acuticoccus mangrovi]MBJ3776378.1 GNAT family N-acetyltransferase [Acuticoccus mangrovi]